MKHVTLNERMLSAQNLKLEQRIKELELLVSEYRESFETMKEHITELKELNHILTKQIYSITYEHVKAPSDV